MERSDKELAEEIAALRREVARLNSHRFIRVQNSVAQLLMLQFARGLALGLGTVVGASVLVSVVLYLLAQIDFIPILGEWAAEISDQIQSQVQVSPEGSPPAAPPGGENR